MDPNLVKTPRYLTTDIPLEERVELFNQRRHPGEMTAQERGEEMIALANARIPLAIFMYRLEELAGPGNDHISIASNITNLTLDAIKMPGIEDFQPLKHLTVADCQPKIPGTTPPLRFPGEPGYKKRES